MDFSTPWLLILSFYFPVRNEICLSQNFSEYGVFNLVRNIYIYFFSTLNVEISYIEYLEFKSDFEYHMAIYLSTRYLYLNTIYWRPFGKTKICNFEATSVRKLSSQKVNKAFIPLLNNLRRFCSSSVFDIIYKIVSNFLM